MQAALSLRSMRLYAEPAAGSRGWSGSGRGEPEHIIRHAECLRRVHAAMAGKACLFYRLQRFPVASFSGPVNFRSFQNCCFFFGHYAVYLLFFLYLRLDGTICANGGFHPTRQQETMRFVSRGRSSGQTACTNSTYRVLGPCCKAPQADPAIPYTDKYPCMLTG